MARIPVATHMDGLEWKRAKWGTLGKRYYRWAERFSVRFSNALIADAAGIRDYYRATFNAATQLISYGAPLLAPREPERLAGIGLSSGQYHLVVARLEPEKHVHMIVEGYVRSAAKLPLVVVGTTPYGQEYSQKVQDSADSRVRFLGGVWDQELLDELYANALVYWHGHSVGGTNPSLLRAIGAGTATNALTSTSTARCWSQPANTSGTRPTSHGWPRTLRRVSPEPDREGAKPGKLRRSTTGTWWQIFTKRCATGWTPVP